jgi:hypothetical protein
MKKIKGYLGSAAIHYLQYIRFNGEYVGNNMLAKGFIPLELAK